MFILLTREEEQQYLKFISDVTTDILARGIFSNRYCFSCLENPVQNKSKLNTLHKPFFGCVVHLYTVVKLLSAIKYSVQRTLLVTCCKLGI